MVVPDQDEVPYEKDIGDKAMFNDEVAVHDRLPEAFIPVATPVAQSVGSEASAVQVPAFRLALEVVAYQDESAK